MIKVYLLLFIKMNSLINIADEHYTHNSQEAHLTNKLLCMNDNEKSFINERRNR